MKIEKPAIEPRKRDRSSRVRSGVRLEIRQEWVDVIMKLVGEKVAQFDILSPEFKSMFALYSYLQDRLNDKR